MKKVNEERTFFYLVSKAREACGGCESHMSPLKVVDLIEEAINWLMLNTLVPKAKHVKYLEHLCTAKRLLILSYKLKPDVFGEERVKADEQLYTILNDIENPLSDAPERT